MSINGLIDISKSCSKAGIEVHTGVRLRIVDDPSLRGPDGKLENRNAYYIKAWAKTDAGVQQLYKLLSRSYDEDRFFFMARLSLQDVFDNLKPEDILITTGDIAGLFTRHDHAVIFGMLKRHFDDMMVELIPVPTPYFERININAIKCADASRHSGTLLTFPTLFAEGNYEALRLNLAIQNRSDFRHPFTFADPHFKEFGPKTAEELTLLIRETARGMKMADDKIDLQRFALALKTGNETFLNQTAYRWKKQEVSLPQLVDDAPKAVLEACKLGIKDRLSKDIFGYKPTVTDIRERYIPRLKYELDVLTTLGFCDYFIVVADLVNWAKSEGIAVGPGRGSIGGSLISYLMGITDIDPIRFGLLFERFINPSRNDLPDADLDFMSTRREEIITYLEKKYGEDRVCGITNYGVLGSASALKDVARLYGVDMTNFAASKHIPSVHGQPVSLEEAHQEVAEIQKFASANPRVWSGALKVQGVMRSYGRHAAGTIVAGVPVIERGVVQKDGNSRKVNWDMRVVEDQGLVKFDVLGLSTLDTLARAVSYIWDRHMKRVDLLEIPLDDAATLKAFSEGETIGVFQFEGGAARRILKDMAQTSLLTFDDLVAANALNRPGPIDAGLVKDYVDCRNGNRSITYPHALTENALRETYGVICYQEQVMQIGVDLCSFSLSEADKLRKAMGKKDPVLMASFRKQFVDGANSVAGMDEAEADALFTQIEGFAGYAFNKSHAAEYSLISYQCMWLKVHYGVEFYAAVLSTVDEKKLQVIVNDAKFHGITVLPPDINISTNEFVIGTDTTLYVPFNRIKGVSEKGGQAIIDGRNLKSITEEVTVGRGASKVTATITHKLTPNRFDDIADFERRVEKRLVNVRVRENLEKIGAFHRIDPTSKTPMDISRRKDQMILMPGLSSGLIEVDRVIPTDAFTLAYLGKLRDEIRAVDDKIVHVTPMVGRHAKFMVVSDCATQDEEALKSFAGGSSFQYVAGALKVTNLERRDAYWTGLIKRKKAGKSLSPTEIKTYQPFFERELELVKPPVILTLGSAAARFFIPDIKGDIMDHVGRLHYSEKYDAMIVIGFNPMMIHFAPDKFDILAELFETVRTMILPDT